ncbi:orotate phosphoribosyltransferase [Ceraceosorus guamensis]|uniref:orotate phosphoribosyltransferase n=1 Tax=Ceraceosorus guamensis TaxID=1522189 RepID=A0A316VYP5_9BASI|nr:orotate phosphoribosyltransferase [Ceraceosorus guamensis]PWN42028.1 orotate phosphoribosyltransferase [Ceraceosorus guamensis]
MSSSTLKPYQNSYLSLSLSRNILRFDGPFTLKSGRKSPYFFNAGLFCDGESIAQIANCYAQMIKDSGLEVDVILGPAYKGIPLAATVTQALYEKHNIRVGFAYNRKEVKAHGEGGILVGAPLKGNVLIIDDVMTAGTAIGEAIKFIEGAGKEANLVGIAIALDRQERATEETDLSTATAVSNKYQVPVLSVVNVEDIMKYLANEGGWDQQIEAMKEYRLKFFGK